MKLADDVALQAFMDGRIEQARALMSSARTGASTTGRVLDLDEFLLDHMMAILSAEADEQPGVVAESLEAIEALLGSMTAWNSDEELRRFQRFGIRLAHLADRTDRVELFGPRWTVDEAIWAALAEPEADEDDQEEDGLADGEPTEDGDSDFDATEPPVPPQPVPTAAYDYTQHMLFSSGGRRTSVVLSSNEDYFHETDCWLEPTTFLRQPSFMVKGSSAPLTDAVVRDARTLTLIVAWRASEHGEHGHTMMLKPRIEAYGSEWIKIEFSQTEQLMEFRYWFDNGTDMVLTFLT